MRRRWYVVLGVLAVVLGFVGWAMYSERNNIAAEDGLTKALPVAHKQARPIRVADAVPFAWDRLVFACPYEGQETVEQRLGFTWDGFEDVWSDGLAGWIFARGEHVTAQAQLPRYLGDPCEGATGGRAFDRAAAVFRLEETTDRTAWNEAWRRLVPTTSGPD